MSKKKIDKLILQLENFLECWKQFNYYISLARAKQFRSEDESQFMELKSLITQELELILSVIESGAPNKDDIISVISGAPSIRFLSELSDASLRNIENHWHRVFIGWQSILGQLKVQQRLENPPSFFSKLFGRGD